MKLTQVVLVDENDHEVGIAEKMEAHRQGWLHRAFSVFVYNSHGEMLIHRRSAGKYHGAGLWTNACCSHPEPGEDMMSAVDRRLKQEMGMTLKTDKVLKTTYRLDMGNGLIEHEIDHVFLGVTDGVPRPDPEEVEEWAYVAPLTVEADIRVHPNRYTPWFRLLVPQVNAAFNHSEFTKKIVKEHEHLPKFTG